MMYYKFLYALCAVAIPVLQYTGKFGMLSSLATGILIVMLAFKLGPDDE